MYIYIYIYTHIYPTRRDTRVFAFLVPSWAAVGAAGVFWASAAFLFPPAATMPKSLGAILGAAQVRAQDDRA